MAEEFIATILEDNRITIPIEVAKLKKARKGKIFRFAILEEVQS